MCAEFFCTFSTHSSKIFWVVHWLYSFSQCQIIDSWGTNTSLCLRSWDSWGTNTLVCLCSFDSLGTNKLESIRGLHKRSKNTYSVPFDPVRFFRFDLAYFWNKPSSLRFKLSNLWNKQNSLRFDLSKVENKQGSLRFDLYKFWNKQVRFALISKTKSRSKLRSAFVSISLP